MGDHTFKDAIMQSLKDMIDEIADSGGTVLPSESYLALKFQVSRETIRALLLQLEYEGIVFRRHGSGTYINTHRNKSGLLYPCQLFRDVITAYGYRYKVKVTETGIMRPQEEISDKLLIKKKVDAFYIKRIYYADEKPCIFTIYYFSVEKLEKNDIDFMISDKTSIYDIINRLADCRNSSLLWDDTEIYASDSSKLMQFKVPLDEDILKCPYLVQDSVYYDLKNMPLLYSVSYANTQMFRFHFVRSKQP